MKLRVIQSIKDLDYIFVFNIDPDNISSDDNLRIQKFGQPSINFGGSFDNGNGITFTLPDNFVELPGGFPVKKVFNLVDPFDTDSIIKFTLYRTTIETRVTDAITALRNTADTFTGEYLTNI